MNRYYESGNLIVRTDSFGTLKDLSQITRPKNKIIKNNTNQWKFILNGNNYHFLFFISIIIFLDNLLYNLSSYFNHSFLSSISKSQDFSSFIFINS